MAVKTDIEIAREATKKPIMEIGARLASPPNICCPMAMDKAKVSQPFIDSLASRPNGKLILVHRHQPDPPRARGDHHHRGPGRRLNGSASARSSASARRRLARTSG